MNKTVVLVITLVVVAVSVGILFYQNYTTAPSPSQPPGNVTTTPSEANQGTNPNPPPEYSASYRANLTDDEKKIINLDLSDAKVIQANRELIEKTAKSSEILDIASCELKPLVLKAAKGSTIIIRNQDTVEYTITVRNINATVPGGEQREVKADVEGEFGHFASNCDGNARGILFIPGPPPPTGTPR